MSKRLYLSLTFSNLVVIKTLSSNHRMDNLYTKFVKMLEICKQFSENLVNEFHAVVLFLSFRFGNCALSLATETESMNVRSGCSTINCKTTRTAFPISYPVIFQRQIGRPPLINSAGSVSAMQLCTCSFIIIYFNGLEKCHSLISGLVKESKVH